MSKTNVRDVVDTSMKVVFFSPHAGIWLHSGPEFFLMSELQHAGWDVYSVTCDGVLDSFCNVMSASGLREESPSSARHRQCRLCQSTRDQLVRVPENLHRLDLEDFLTEEDISQADLVASMAGCRDWINVTSLGLPVGRLAAYEFILRHKVTSEVFPTELMSSYKRHLRNVMLAVPSARKILDLVKPDRVVVYNGLYGVNRVWKLLGESDSIPSFSLQGGLDERDRYDSLMVYRDDLRQLRLTTTETARAAMGTALAEWQINRVRAGLTHRATVPSPFVYSRPRQGNLQSSLIQAVKSFGVGPTFLVATSSNDEIYAAGLLEQERFIDNSIFRDQFEWLDEIFKIAAENPHWKFIIRFHPRLFPNPREQVTSRDVARYAKYLHAEAPNVFVNLPSDEVSIYDLYDIVDVGLVRSSTVGLEMAAAGIPVVSSDPNAISGFPSEVAYVAGDRMEYRELMVSHLRSRPDFEKMALAYRYLNFRDHVATRPMKWRISSPVEGNGSKLTSSWTRQSISRLLRTFTRVLPSRLQASLTGYRTIRRGNPISRNELTWADHPEEPSPFVRVLKEALAGLDEVGQEGGSHCDPPSELAEKEVLVQIYHSGLSPKRV